MPRFTVWISDEIAEKLAELPVARDNHSAFFRRLLIDAVGGARPMRGEPPVRGRPKVVRVNLTEADVARLHQEAAAFGFGHSAWIASLVGRRFRKEPRFSVHGEATLVGIQMELRRIALSLVRLAQSDGDLRDQDGRLKLDAEALMDLRAEVRGHMASIRAAFKGNLDYWQVADE